MSSRTEQLIQQKKKEIEELQANAYTEDIINVLQNKKHTEQDLEIVCRAFLKHVDYKKRKSNLERARKEKKEHPEPQAESA